MIPFHVESLDLVSEIGILLEFRSEVHVEVGWLELVTNGFAAFKPVDLIDMLVASVEGVIMRELGLEEEVTVYYTINKFSSVVASEHKLAHKVKVLAEVDVEVKKNL